MDHDEFDGDLLRRIAEFASKTMSEGAQAIQIAKAVDDRVRFVSFILIFPFSLRADVCSSKGLRSDKWAI